MISINLRKISNTFALLGKVTLLVALVALHRCLPITLGTVSGDVARLVAAIALGGGPGLLAISGHMASLAAVEALRPRATAVVVALLFSL